MNRIHSMLSVPVFVLASSLAGCSDASANADEPAPAIASEVSSVEAAPGDRCNRDFKATLQVHLDAVQRRDLRALAATLTQDDDLYLFFPSGTLLETRQQFLDWHRDWFTSTTWTMRNTPIRTVCSESMAVAAFRNHYEDTDGPDGKLYVSDSYMTLTFARQHGHWGLVHDQNTRIPPQ